MAQQFVQRRLAAILAADIVGYSRLMGSDEEGTLAGPVLPRSLLILQLARTAGRSVTIAT
jgi:adenylate cyclase